LNEIQNIYRVLITDIATNVKMPKSKAKPQVPDPVDQDPQDPNLSNLFGDNDDNDDNAVNQISPIKKTPEEIEDELLELELSQMQGTDGIDDGFEYDDNGNLIPIVGRGLSNYFKKIKNVKNIKPKMKFQNNNSLSQYFKNNKYK
jgi:hypothetical protein